MDEPLCFVHFINALTCSNKESGGHCSGEGGNKNAGRLLPLSHPFPLERAAERSMGSSLWALWGLVLHGTGEEATSLGWPDFKH